MAEQRLSGRSIRDAIQAAALAFHRDHDTWPTRRVLATLVGISADLVRYHVDYLIEMGAARRNVGGAIQILRQDGIPPIMPVATVVLDENILSTVAELQTPDGAPVLITSISRRIKRPRYILSRRAAYLVHAGRLVRVGKGYRTMVRALLMTHAT